MTEREVQRRTFIRNQNRARQSPPRVHFEDSEQVAILSPEGAASPLSVSEGGESNNSNHHNNDEEEGEIPLDFNLDQEIQIEEPTQAIPNNI